MAYSGQPGYLELNQNSTQAITNSTITAVQFPNSVKNTFGNALGITGTGNTTFTNNSGADMFLIVAASAIPDSSSASVHAGWLYLKFSRAIGNATTIFQNAIDGSFSNTLGLSICTPAYLASGDSFQIACLVNVNQTLGNSATLYTQVFRTSLIIMQQ